MNDTQTINIQEIMIYWGFTDAEPVKCFHPDSARIVAQIRTGGGDYILRGIPDAGDGESRGEETI
ncbi:MAG: hypothetical protein K2O97_06980, partial [Acetatifactor sp.]|nr:hypothetical protein [Acetatifactor sp.]